MDDGANGQNPDPIVFGRGGLPLSASNTLRGGDTDVGDGQGECGLVRQLGGGYSYAFDGQ